MTRIKSYLLTFFLLCITSVAFAEQTYRLEVGYIQPYQNSEEFRSTYFNGAKIGGTVDFHFPYNMTIQTGLSYLMSYGINQQNFTTTATDNIEVVTRNIYNHTVEIPVRYTYTLKIWKDLALFAYAGPNFQIGLAQTEKLSSTLPADKEAQFGIVSGTTDAYQTKDLRRFNLQLGVGGGVQWDCFRLKSGYDFGMFSVSSKAKIHQSGWYASFSYAF